MDIDMVMDCEKKITFCTQIKVHFLVVILVFVCSHSEALGVDELSLNFVVQRNRAAFSETDAECNGFTELPCQSPMPSTSMGVVQLLLSIRRPCLLFFKGRGENKHVPWTFFKHVDIFELVLHLKLNLFTVFDVKRIWLHQTGFHCVSILTFS